MPGVLPQVLDCRLHAGVFVEAAKRHAPAPQLVGLPVLVGDDQGGGVEAHATLEQLKSTGSHGDGLLVLIRCTFSATTHTKQQLYITGGSHGP